MFSNVCRTCFGSYGGLRNIFDFCEINKALLSEMLIECCSIHIKNNDGYSNMMCDSCIKSLHIAYLFRKKCLKTQKLFEEKLCNGINVEYELNHNDFFEVKTEQEEKNENENKKVVVNSEVPAEKGNVRKKRKYRLFNQNLNGVGVKCTECDRVFDSKLKMYGHRKYHRKYVCDRCDKMYSRKTSLSYHIRVAHYGNKPQIPCPMCDQTFTIKANMRRHIRVSHEKFRAYKCVICDRDFTAKHSLITHMKTHNKTYSDRRKRNFVCSSLIREKLQCKICNKYFFVQEFYEKHLKDHADDNVTKYSCDICCIQFLDKLDLKRHNVREHQLVETEEKTMQELLCSDCGQVFSTFWKLKKHMFYHTNERPYKCSYCGKGFNNQQGCKMHLRIHLNLRRYKCKYCEKDFIQSQHLKSHLRQHTGEKPYQCDLCLKTFMHKTNRDAHRRTHTGERPYLCKYCSESFYDAGRLSKHIKKIHPDVKSLQT